MKVELLYTFWLWVGFGAMALTQLIYYLAVFLRIAKKLPDYGPGGKEGVTVIICARNERENLEKNLASVLSQDHSDFQVIVVNDGSYDGSRDYLSELAKSNDRLKIVELDIDERYHRGKKFALTMGIKAAQHENLLLTDADCTPDTDQWIRKMTAPLENGKEVVLGVSMFPPATGMLSWIVRVETFHTALQYLNFALAGKPYMGVGRNLAYKKSLFFKVKGFASHQHLMSGDDDLFINEVATKENTAVVYDADAQTTSKPSTSFGSWYRQKSRHFSTGRYYKGSHKLLLTIYSLSLFLFYATGIFLACTGFNWIYLVIPFGVRLITQFIVFGINLKKLNATRLIWSTPFVDLIILMIQIFVGIKGSLSKPKTWN